MPGTPRNTERHGCIDTETNTHYHTSAPSISECNGIHLSQTICQVLSRDRVSLLLSPQRRVTGA